MLWRFLRKRGSILSQLAAITCKTCGMSEGNAGTPDTSDMTSGMSGVTSLAATGISEGPGMDPGSESVVGKSVSANGL